MELQYVIVVNCFDKFYLLLQGTVKRLVVERKVLRTLFGGIRVNENCWYTDVFMQSPGMPQPALCHTACHSASLYVVSTTRIGSGGASVASLPDYNARINQKRIRRGICVFRPIRLEPFLIP